MIPDARLRLLARQHAGAGNAARWKLAHLAGYAVGKRDGLTAQIASDNHLGIDQIENLAGAAVTFRYFPIRNESGRLEFCRLAELKWRLSPSHWMALGQAIVKHDIPLNAAYADLLTALETGAGVRAFRAQLAALYGDRPESPHRFAAQIHRERGWWVAVIVEDALDSELVEGAAATVTLRDSA